MLRACARILRPGGRTAFLTIAITQGLSKKDHRRAARLGPRSVASSRPSDELMEAAGFTQVETIDVTHEFLETAKRWLGEYSEHEEELRPLMGAEFDQLRKNRADMIVGIEEGLFERTLVFGVKPE